MANSMRVVWDNAADRGVVTATSEIMPASSLQQDSKSTVWRAGGTSDSVKIVFSTAENISCVALPYCNLSPTATMRVRLTQESVATNLLTYSELFSNAAWVKTNTTLTSTISNPRDTTSAFTLTAGAGVPKSLKYTISSGTALVNVNSIWMRRRTGSGDVNIWSPSEITPLTISGMSSNWTRYSVANASAHANRTFLIEMTVTGDEIDIFAAQMELGLLPTSYYPTTTAALARPLGYIDSWQTYAYDSGAVLVNTSSAVKVIGLTSSQSSSAYNYGGGRSAVAYCTTMSATGARIDIVDSSNLQGYLEASRLVIGDYFAPVYDAEVGAKISFEDTGKNFRNDAGNLMSDIGTRNKLIDVNLGMMQEVDRAALWKIVSYCGTSYPVFMSIYPGNVNKDLEQAYTVYGKFSNISKLAAKAYGVWEAPLTVEGI